MTVIEVKPGGPDIEDGVHEVTLVSIEGPKTITPQSGKNAGQPVQILDWKFAVDQPGPAEGIEITATTSTASGPNSKMFSFLTALLGGKAPPIGARFESADLVGRVALATVRRNERGWPRVENLSAAPRRAATSGHF